MMWIKVEKDSLHSFILTFSVNSVTSLGTLSNTKRTADSIDIAQISVCRIFSICEDATVRQSAKNGFDFAQGSFQIADQSVFEKR